MRFFMFVGIPEAYGSINLEGEIVIPEELIPGRIYTENFRLEGWVNPLVEYVNLLQSDWEEVFYNDVPKIKFLEK